MSGKDDLKEDPGSVDAISIHSQEPLLSPKDRVHHGILKKSPEVPKKVKKATDVKRCSSNPPEDRTRTKGLHKKKDEFRLPKHIPTNENIVRSGHLEFQSLYATNDMETPSFVVNTLGAPNNSTLVCGCDNVTCPFCNMVLSIKNRDPTLDTEDIINSA
ncbi:uncharacterized protein LOC111717100 [Eurytemora carolleeae]|uniref:uncharacterized protein LOC111717100 n=1 Tax=Eurytemora carolleeae TaxID=1294199 RepID=UPI000C78D9FD|nr:uncharacterized protein LOC111717100 [Eurytemora carolleeae]|eukprot:XP_023348380.1 uncharacterized protein LOC111717100 [Eurytemora affinis]